MSIVKELNDLAVSAGNPGEDLTILAEGNAAAFDPDSNKFLVKASGVVMGSAKEEDWVWLDLEPCVENVLAETHLGIQRTGGGIRQGGTQDLLEFLLKCRLYGWIFFLTPSSSC